MEGKRESHGKVVQMVPSGQKQKAIAGNDGLITPTLRSVVPTCLSTLTDRYSLSALRDQSKRH